MRVPLFLLAALAASAAVADKIDDLAKAEMAAMHCPGMSVTVVRDGKVIKQGAYGISNIELGTKVNLGTVFEIGSVSKQFTSAAILQMVEAGKMSLDDTVGKWLPESPDEWKPVTVRQLLSHTSGIRDYLGVTFDMRKDWSTDALLKEIAKKPCEYAPGLTWSYSNGGYAVAGAILEKVCGQAWDKQIATAIFDKLGMQETRMQSQVKLVPNRSGGYTWDGKVWANAEILRKGAASAAGSILSTGGDMAKWALAIDQGKVCSPALMSEAFKPITLSSGRTWNYGLGWFVDTSGPDRIIEHGGNTFGESAYIMRVPAKNFTVIVLSNIAGQSFAGLSRQIMHTYWPAPKPPVLPEPKEDPDQNRSDRVRSAFKAIGAGKTPEDLFEPEAIASFNTTRGKMALAGAKSFFGKMVGFRYVKEKPEGTDTIVLYRVYNKDDSILMGVRLSPAGKIVRLGEEQG